MGGRGGSSASAKRGGGGAGVSKEMQDNARRHEKYINGELGTKITKDDEFMMKMLYPDMDYNKVRESASSTYVRANRVSKDEEHIAVMVGPGMLKPTRYGFALQLDETHVQYVKGWQLKGQYLPYKGQVGTNVSLSKKYWNPKEAKASNPDFFAEAENLSWGHWLSVAKMQQSHGNIVSVRVR